MPFVDSQILPEVASVGDAKRECVAANRYRKRIL